MINDLNELSALYLQNIAEQGPEEQQQRVTQIVKAIRYRARKEGVDLSKAFNDYIGSVQATSTERQAVKEKLGLTGGAAHKEEVEYEIEEGMTMKDFKKQRSRQKQKDKRAADKIAPGRRAGIHADKASPERAARHRANVDPDYDRDDEEDMFPGGKLRPNKVRKAKALGELGESAVPGKPAEKLGAVTGIPKSEQEAARERIKAKMAAKKAAKKVAESSYDPMDDDEFDHDEAEENRGVSGKNNPKGGKALGKKKKVVQKESYHNWREDLREVADEVESEKQIKEKKVKNKVIINPSMKEAFEEIGGTILEFVEVEEQMGAETQDKNKMLANKQMMMRKQLQLKRQELQLQKQDKLPLNYSEEVVDEGIRSTLAGAGLAAAVAASGVGKKADSAKPAPQSQSSSAAQVQSSKSSPKEIWAKAHPDLAAKEASTKKPASVKSQLSDIRDMIARSKERQQQNNSFEPQGELVDEKMNLVKAKMGDVVKDFYKSDAPQFKGKSKKKRQQMAIAAKLTAERGGKGLSEASPTGYNKGNKDDKSPAEVDKTYKEIENIRKSIKIKKS